MNANAIFSCEKSVPGPISLSLRRKTHGRPANKTRIKQILAARLRLQKKMGAGVEVGWDKLQLMRDTIVDKL
jgi:hypothetical protein